MKVPYTTYKCTLYVIQMYAVRYKRIDPADHQVRISSPPPCQGDICAARLSEARHGPAEGWVRSGCVHRQHTT